jgi:hypothetical protein
VKDMASFAGPSDYLNTRVLELKKSSASAVKLRKTLHIEICAQLSEMAGAARVVSNVYKNNIRKADESQLVAFQVTDLEEATASLEGYCGISRNIPNPVSPNDLDSLQQRLLDLTKLVDGIK